MIVVIIAGGSGTRLWPLSQQDHPKHLLSLTGTTSMLQDTYGRVQELTDKVYVATEASHAKVAMAQLENLAEDRFIIEPARRGTASVMALALAYLAEHEDEAIVFLHSDHHISDAGAFAHSVGLAVSAAERRQTIALVGLQPTYPATGFGYIKTGGTLDEANGIPVLAVEAFKEKPDAATAKRYVESGMYLWNQGLFAARHRVFIEAFRTFAPDLLEDYKRIRGAMSAPDRLAHVYSACETRQIDTALIEKAEGVVAVPGQFDWTDVGSFFDLHNLLKGADSNVRQGKVEMIDCNDSMVHGHDKPVIAIGLEGIVVVDSPDGLLVCAKDKAQLVGEAVKRLKNS